MRSQQELTTHINECENKIKKLDANLNTYHAELEPKIAPLVKKSEQKENEKKNIEKKPTPAKHLWLIVGALVVGGIVFNVLRIVALSGLLVLAAIGVGLYAYKLKKGVDSEYEKQIAEIDAELDEIQNKIDAIYDSDSRIVKAEQEIEKLEKELELAKQELAKVNAIEADKKAFERLGTNNLIVYCSFVGIATNKCYPILDGVERDMMTNSFALYYLNPGEHTYFMNVVRPETIIDMNDIDFTVDGNNKYIYIKHDMRTYEYETKVFDGFEEFAANFKDSKWVKDEIVKLIK